MTSLCWSQDGNFLFATNSNGSVYILEFNEFKAVSRLSGQTSSTSKEASEKIINYNTNTNKKRITPQIINNLSNIQSNLAKNNIHKRENANSPVQQNYNNTSQINLSSNSQIVQDCLRCQKLKYDSLETKTVQIKIDSLNQSAAIIYENKVYDNYSTITLKLSDKIFYHNKFENKLIRIFSANNSFYVIYDANNLLSVFTIFNTMVKINLHRFYKICILKT